MNKEDILKILEGAKDKNGDVPMRLVRQVLEKLPIECENDKHCSNCIYSGRPTYKSPCSECHDKSQWEMKPISRSHENGAEREDAVSRKQVLKLFSTHDGKYLYEAIQMLPSVTPKRKTGKWIEYDSDEDKYDVIKCPCCKHTFIVDAYHWTDIGFVKDDFKFCPNCGSKNGDARNE